MSSRKRPLALRAFHLFGELAVLDDANARHRLYAQLLRQGLVLGDVRKRQRELALVLRGQAFQGGLGLHRWRDLIGPEDHHHRHLPGALDHVGLEGAQIDLEDVGRVHWYSVPGAARRDHNTALA